MNEDFQTGLINEFFEGGWRIVPFNKSDGGYIGVTKWPERAATNMSELEALCAEKNKVSRRLIVYGVSPPKGRFIVDIDTKKNPQALQLWYDKAETAIGDASINIEPNFIVKSKSGGYHLYYSSGLDRAIGSPTAIFGKDSGIDIRGSTGMVIMPTSYCTEAEWVRGQYSIIKGSPADPCVVLPIYKVIQSTVDSEESRYLEDIILRINDVLRNECIFDDLKHRQIPQDIIIPASMRDSSLFRLARLCVIANLSKVAAQSVISALATRCELLDGETVEEWINVGLDKVERAYKDLSLLVIKSVTQIHEEFRLTKAVKISDVTSTYVFFRYASRLLNVSAHKYYTVENLATMLSSKSVKADDGSITPVRKIISSFDFDKICDGFITYPRADVPIYKDGRNYYVNLYNKPFEGFEPVSEIAEEASKYIPMMQEYILHICGNNKEDAKYLTNKIGWMIQRPYRRLPTATIIYSATRGSGKDIFVSLIGRLMGKDYYIPLELTDFESQFNNFHDKLIACVSEVQTHASADGHRHAAQFMGRIKNIVTTKTVHVNEKYKAKYTVPIFTNFFILSNYNLSQVIEHHDRRFDVFRTVERKLDQAKFGALADLTNDGKWSDRSAHENKVRDHAIYLLREYFESIDLPDNMDTQEARLNESKIELLEERISLSHKWLRDNLPDYFYEDLVNIAMRFNPHKGSADYAFKQIQDTFSTEIKLVTKSVVPTLIKYNTGAYADASVSTLSLSNKAIRKIYSFLNHPNNDIECEDVEKTVLEWLERMEVGSVTTISTQRALIKGKSAQSHILENY